MKHCSWSIVTILVVFSGCGEQEATVSSPMPSSPVVTITSPTNNSEVLESILIEVQASDDKGVTKVEIYIDNTLVSTFAVPPYNYLWDASNQPDSSLHYIYAKGYDADDNVTSSKVISVVAYSLTPSGLAAVVVSDKLIELSWNDNSQKEGGYQVEQKLNGGDFTVVATVGANAESFQVLSGFSTQDTISYRVAATAFGVLSKYSNVATVIVDFPEPSGLSLWLVSFNSVRIDWSDNSTFESGFAVERKTGTGDFVEVSRVAANATTWTDNLLDTLQDYQYRIRAYTEINTSNYSDTLAIEYSWTDSLYRSIETGASNPGPVVYSPDGTIVAVGGYNDILLYSAADGSLLRELTTGAGNILSLSFSGDDVLASGGYDDQKIRLWNTSTGELLQTISTTEAVVSVALSSSGAMVASGGGDGKVGLYGTALGNKLWEVVAHFQEAHVIFAPNGLAIYSSGLSDRTIYKWNATTGTVVWAAPLQGGAATGNLALGFGGTILANGTSDNLIELRDTSNGAVFRGLSGSPASIYSFTFNDARSLFAAGFQFGSVYFWSSATWDWLLSISTDTDPVSMDFSPDGSLLATIGGSIGVLNFWRIFTGWRVVLPPSVGG